MTTANLPPAPQIDGDAMLEIFVHRSIRFPGAPANGESPYGDGARLSLIGSKMLEAAYANVLFYKRPPLSSTAYAAELRNLPQKIERWVAGYQWREKVRHAEGVDLNAPAETRYIMDAYVGAVFLGGGFTAVVTWIHNLVEAGSTRRTAA